MGVVHGTLMKEPFTCMSSRSHHHPNSYHGTKSSKISFPVFIPSLLYNLVDPIKFSAGAVLSTQEERDLFSLLV